MDFNEQRRRLESALMRLKVDQLKAIAREFKSRGFAHVLLSGVKAEFIQRIISVIEAYQLGGKWDKVEILVRLMNVHSRGPHMLPMWTIRDRSIFAMHQLSAQQRAEQSSSSAPRSTLREVKFRPNPFYVIEKCLAGPVEFSVPPKSYPQQRVVRFVLKDDTLALLRLPVLSDGKPKYQVRFFCASLDHKQEDNNRGLLIEFPSVSDIKVNDSITVPCEALRGRKNKPGVVNPPDLSCNPPQLTPRNTIRMNYINKFEVERRYVFTIELVRRSTVSSLIDELKEKHIMTKEHVLQNLSGNSNDMDIVMESETVSTRCPLSLIRIETPIRSRSCHHLQCFDATTFLRMNELVPTWECPVCSRPIEKLEDLVIDEHFVDLLKNVSSGVTHVQVESNGALLALNEDSDEDSDSSQGMTRETSYHSAGDGLGGAGTNGLDEAPLMIPKQQEMTPTAVEQSPVAQRQDMVQSQPNASVIDLTFSSDDEAENDSPPLPRNLTSASQSRESSEHLIPNLHASPNVTYSSPSHSAMPNFPLPLPAIAPSAGQPALRDSNVSESDMIWHPSDQSVMTALLSAQEPVQPNHLSQPDQWLPPHNPTVYSSLATPPIRPASTLLPPLSSPSPPILAPGILHSIPHSTHLSTIATSSSPASPSPPPQEQGQQQEQSSLTQNSLDDEDVIIDI